MAMEQHVGDANTIATVSSFPRWWTGFPVSVQNLLLLYHYEAECLLNA